MDNPLHNSQLNSDIHKQQRDSARTERDSALDERNRARIERDTLKSKATNLEKSHAAQEMFLATVSHDLRNPIGAIKMAVEVIREGASQEQLQCMIDLIDRNVDLAGDLISQLLDAHLINSGGTLPMKPEQCDLIPILEGCLHALPPQHQNKVVFKADHEKHLWGYWDVRALERAFNNLISNAIKYTNTNKDIQIHAWQEEEIIKISFQNFGEMIPLEDQIRIFDSHFRVQNTETQSQRGWGLGLTLVRGIAEAHKGTVEVVSTKENGTTFILKIPTDSRTPEQH